MISYQPFNYETPAENLFHFFALLCTSMWSHAELQQWCIGHTGSSGGQMIQLLFPENIESSPVFVWDFVTRHCGTLLFVSDKTDFFFFLSLLGGRLLAITAAASTHIKTMPCQYRNTKREQREREGGRERANVGSANSVLYPPQRLFVYTQGERAAVCVYIYIHM